MVPFHKIHSHVSSLSLKGYKYYVTFINDCTRFVRIFPLVSKSDTFSTFVKFHQFVHTQFHLQIQILQSDGGGEYTSKVFKNFLEQRGILHYITCPYTPQQNGITKRKNRHIVETCITVMIAAKLPKPFWFHVVAHSAYLINRMPCQVLGMQSPFTKLFGSALDLSNLKIFGSACYPFLRPYVSEKLDTRTTRCVLFRVCSWI